MARRKQLKCVAGNLVNWCLSRNFDSNGYWAVGKIYRYAEVNKTDVIVIKLIDDFDPIDLRDAGLPVGIRGLFEVFQGQLDSLNIPCSWIRDAQVTFKFNVDFQERYHHWGSALGGDPALCVADITTDLGKTYTKERGGNVWPHEPKKERRRHESGWAGQII